MEAARGRGAWASRGGWSRRNNWSKLTRNKGGISVRLKLEWDTIWTMCWVRTGGGIQRVMEGDRRISGELEAARRKDSKGHAVILPGSHKPPCFRWSTLPETENQRTASKDICKHGKEKEGDRSHTRTERILWKRRNVTQGSWAVLVAWNVCQRQWVGKKVGAVG